MLSLSHHDVCDIFWMAFPHPLPYFCLQITINHNTSTHFSRAPSPKNETAITFHQARTYYQERKTLQTYSSHTATTDNPPLTRSDRSIMRLTNFASPAMLFVLAALATIPYVQAGPIAFGVCQAGCATLAVSCYAAAGAVIGTVLAPGALVSCNTAFGTCSAACTNAFWVPVP